MEIKGNSSLNYPYYGLLLWSTEFIIKYYVDSVLIHENGMYDCHYYKGGNFIVMAYVCPEGESPNRVVIMEKEQILSFRIAPLRKGRQIFSYKSDVPWCINTY